MKTKSTFYTLLFAASLLVVFANCSGKKEQAHEHDHAATETETHAADSAAAPEAGKPQFEVDKTFQQQLAAVFNSYISLKEAFVSSDDDKVRTEASTVQSQLSKTDMKLLSGAAHNDWMHYLEGLESSLKEIQTNKDIEVQRRAFSKLSDNLYKSIKAFGLDGTTAYYEFCPMAFNDEGAYWLSDQQKIRNPYFGDEMLTCGVVKEKLQ
jgi:Cu(I)/Ag(I) efflux system membrane fusion protein